MPLNRSSAVIGAAIAAPLRSDPRSLEELLYDVVQDALKDAGLTIEEIDGIVTASNDQFDGRAIAVMAASGSVGGVDRDILSTPSASEHAFVMSTLRLASGLYDTHLVVSWSTTEASSLAEAQRLGADPYYHRRLPLDETAALGLQAVSISAASPAAGEAARRLTETLRARPVSGPSASELKSAPQGALPWPLESGMVSPPVTGAVALVLASDRFVREKSLANPAWIRGMGWTTEAGFLGDRDLNTAPALEAVRAKAYEEAGLTDPRGAIDVAELTDASPYQALLVAEGLGLSPRSKWQEDAATGLFAESSSTKVNPSGGVVRFNPVFCTGLIRIAEAANQVRGKAGSHQVKNARTAIAHAASGFAMTYQTVIVFGSQAQGALS